MNKLLWNIILAILCTLPTVANADAFYDTYQRGLVAFRARDYSNARSEFLRAYDLRPEPIILFNVAQTYRLELSLESALIYYKRFLGESRTAEDLRRKAQRYVDELEAEQRTRDEQRKRDASTGPRERDGTPVKIVSPPLENPRPPSSSVALRDPVKGQPSMSPSVTWRALAIGAAGTSVVAATAGVVLGIMAKEKQDNAYELCRDPVMPCARASESNALIQSSQARAFAANVAFGVAATTAISGAILWFTGARAMNNRPQIGITAIPASHGVSVIVTRRF